MKKQLRLAGLLLCLAQTFIAQTHINQDFAAQISAAFAPLEKDRVPYGLLKDFAMEFTELDAYNGVLTDTNYVTPVALKQIYHTLFMARIHPTADDYFISPQDYNQQWHNQRTAHVITLSGLCYNYARFAPGALAANKLQVVNNQFTDHYINDTWQDPYQTAKTFAIAPAVKTHKGIAFTVVLPQELWHTNEANPVQLLEIDVDDGQGWQSLAFNQYLEVSYGETGTKHWQYRLTLAGGETLYSHSKIYIEDGLDTKFHANPYQLKINTVAQATEPYGTHSVTATTAYNGEFGSATLLIDYAHADGLIRNPLIVVEGFDPGILIAPEAEFGITDIDYFLDIIQFSQSDPLETLLTGNTQAYDIIYVNWDNGVDYIQRNAYVLQEVIAWVNQQKAAAGSVEPNVVWGQSMGGLIARYALADMEENGLPHDTALYISHDAPHLGANIPLGYQYFSRHALHQYVQSPLQFQSGEAIVPLFTDGVSPLDFLLLQNTPAARQMLINYVDVDYSINNSQHNTWQQELQTKGYPAIRRIAVSNGSHCAIPQNAAPGDPLFSFNGHYSTGWLTDIILTAFPVVSGPLFEVLSVFTQEPGFLVGILPGGNEIDMDFDVYAVSGNAGQVYNGEITYTKTLLWAININTTLTSEQFSAPAGMLTYDTYPGGVYDTGIRNTNNNNNGNFWQQLLFKYNMNITTEPTFSFVPTASALDIGRGNIPLTHEDYQGKYNAETPPLAPKDSPFDNFTSSFQNSFVVGGDNYTSANEQHIGLHFINGNWLAAELDAAVQPQVFNCNFVCEDGSIVISGDNTLCTSANYTVPAGGDAQVNWWVDDPGAVTLAPVGNSVTLTANSGQHTPVTLTAEITSLDCNRIIEITKNIWVGKPEIPAYITGPETVVTGALVAYQGGPSAGATSYTWYLPYPYDTVANYDYLSPNWQMYSTNHTSLQAFTGTGQHAGYIQLMGENACGCGGAKLLYVTHAGAGGGGGGENDPIPTKPGGGIPKLLPGETSDDDITSKETEYLLLYPNPADKKITVQLSGSETEKITAPRTIRSINVFDMLSRKAALSVPFTGEKTEAELDISHLAPGYYMVIIRTDTGDMARKLIVE